MAENLLFYEVTLVMRTISLFLLSVCYIFSVNAYAQQAIVNMPSADITPEGKHFLMHETQVRPNNPGRYWYATNFYCYGLGSNTELAITTYNTGTPVAPNENIGIGFKKAIPLFEDRYAEREIKLTVGQMLTYNLRNGGMGSFTYAHTSFRLPKTGTRLTGGVSAGTEALFKKNTVHFITGVEHPLIDKKLYVIGEWFSGQHDFGAFTPGILYHPTKNQVVVVGYKIPNSKENGRSGFVVEYGIFF